MSVPHPIPYQGSKRNLANAIMRYFPQDIETLIEPFAGSAALSIATAYQGVATNYILNDINAPLMALWHYILHTPERIALYYEKLWQAQQGDERAFYDRVRTRFNTTHQPYYFLYLLARCVKASVRYNTQGEFNQSPDNRRKGRKPETMRKDILATAYLLGDKTQVYSLPYEQVLQQAKAGDLVYLDPPYQCIQANPRYMQSVNFADFVQQLNNLNRRGIAYIVSYDGRTGTKRFGQMLPQYLDLTHVELDAGRSSQATLLGKNATTYESLYLSPALMPRLRAMPEQLPLFKEMA